MSAAVCVTDRAGRPEASRVWPVYEKVFADFGSFEEWARVWDLHSAREGFRLARAYEGRELVGFAYGYTGERGQWWTDAVANTLSPGVAREWLGGHYELVAMGVLADHRGRGLGTELMVRLTEHLPHSRWLLMTADDESSPARRLYDRMGWTPLGPGTRPDTVVMGRPTFALEK